MLVVVDSPLASLDPGSVALALVRCFSADGLDVLLIDANCSGTALADRLGEAMNLNFSPGERGIPTLMVAAGEQLSSSEVRANSYRLDNPMGASPLLALAPASRRGAAATVSWLDSRAEDILDLDESFRVVVAASLKRLGTDAPVGILTRATDLVVIAPAGTDEQTEALADPFAGVGLPVVPGQRRMLLVEGDSNRAVGELAELSSLEVVGTIPDVEDGRLLTPRRRLRRRLDPIAAILDLERRPAPVKPGRRGARREAPSGGQDGEGRPAPVKPGRRRRGRAAAPSAPTAPPPRNDDRPRRRR